MAQEGEPAAPPAIRLTDDAREVLREATIDAGGILRVTISEQFEHDLYFDTRRPGDLEIACDGITILVDESSARRADGLVIDFVTGPDGPGFTLENPNQPGNR